MRTKQEKEYFLDEEPEYSQGDGARRDEETNAVLDELVFVRLNSRSDVVQVFVQLRLYRLHGVIRGLELVPKSPLLEVQVKPLGGDHLVKLVPYLRPQLGELLLGGLDLLLHRAQLQLLRLQDLALKALHVGPELATQLVKVVLARKLGGELVRSLQDELRDVPGEHVGLLALQARPLKPPHHLQRVDQKVLGNRLVARGEGSLGLRPALCRDGSPRESQVPGDPQEALALLQPQAEPGLAPSRPPRQRGEEAHATGEHLHVPS
mmetsp:Transcript_4034/g.14146  ORF Transcript_4034/g.14146 Transcript_4034/m.14146 type:complete len:264 (+) Transcript_4034:29-820(+)